MPSHGIAGHHRQARLSLVGGKLSSRGCQPDLKLRVRRDGYADPAPR
jgi:hypothetical protein